MSCRILFAVGAGALLLAGSGYSARAQLGAVGGQTGPAIEAPPPLSGRESPLDERGRAENALRHWRLAALSHRLRRRVLRQQSSRRRNRNRAAAWLVPSLLAERTDSISRTSLYAMTDARVYAAGQFTGS